jgi:hypothetical protein
VVNVSEFGSSSWLIDLGDLNLIDLGSRLAFLGAGFWAVFLYRRQIRREAISKAMNFVAEFSQGSIHNCVLKHQSIWEDWFEVLVGRQMSEQEYLRTLRKLIEDHNLEPDINMMVYFFDRLGTETKMRLCDRKTVIGFFGQHASFFWRR